MALLNAAPGKHYLRRKNHDRWEILPPDPMHNHPPIMDMVGGDPDSKAAFHVTRGPWVSPASSTTWPGLSPIGATISPIPNDPSAANIESWPAAGKPAGGHGSQRLRAGFGPKARSPSSLTTISPTAKSANPELLDYQGLWGSGEEYADKILKFADGKRNAQEIRNAVSAEHGPIPLDPVVEYLEIWKKIGLVDAVKQQSK